MELPEKVYYINLENKQENNKLFLERIHKLNLFAEENIIRFEGIDGHKEGEIKKAIEMTNNRVRFGINNESKQEPGLGQKGCYLSHYLLLKQIYNTTTDECVMICEDDCGYSENFEEYVKQTMKYIQNNNLEVDILQVGNQGFYDTTHKLYLLNKNLKLIKYGTFCTHCYIITRNGIKNLLDYFDGLEENWVIDIDMIHWKSDKKYLIVERKTEEQINKLIQNSQLARSSGIAYQMLVNNNSMHNYTITEEQLEKEKEINIKDYNKYIKKQLENW